MQAQETDFFDWFDALEEELGKFNGSDEKRGETAGLLLIDEANFMSRNKKSRGDLLLNRSGLL